MSPTALGVVASGAQVSGAFTPLSLPGLRWWYDASATASITVGSPNQVASVADQAGIAPALASPSGVISTGVETENGLNALGFAPGVGPSITASTATSAQPAYYFTVIRMKTTGGPQNIFDNISGGSGRNVLGDNGSGSWRMYGGSILDGGTQDTARHVLIATYNGASSDLSVDGVSVVSGNAGTNGLDSLKLGFSTDGWNFCEGFRSSGGVLGAGNLASALAYLKAKWGTP